MVTRSDPYLIKAEPGKKDVINCLSIHWNKPGVTFDSTVYCNGKKISTFTASTRAASPKRESVLGDTHPYDYHRFKHLPFKGDMFSFLAFRGKILDETIIKQIHQYFIQRWGINV